MSKIKKYYAVRNGRKIGIFESWNEAKDQINGYPNAVYKSFKTRLEALEFMNIGSDEKKIGIMKNTLQEEYDNKFVDSMIAKINDNEIVAFVDGSYGSSPDGIQRYSYGAVLITKKKTYKLNKSFNDLKNIKHRNVSGEIKGVEASIEYAVNHGYKKIFIFYDYEGIEKWALKIWKRNIELTKSYSDFIDKNKEKIDMEFFHVKSHTGITYNEMADQLAKDAIEKMK